MESSKIKGDFTGSQNLRQTSLNWKVKVTKYVLDDDDKGGLGGAN